MATKKKNRHMPRSKARNAYELLQEIRELILENPKRYDQEDTLTIGGENAPECGTIGCVAGWVIALAVPQQARDYARNSGVVDRAQRILGLTFYGACLLFDGGAIAKTRPQTKRHALAGAAHIRRFMQTHKDQLKSQRV